MAHCTITVTVTVTVTVTGTGTGWTCERGNLDLIAKTKANVNQQESSSFVAETPTMSMGPHK